MSAIGTIANAEVVEIPNAENAPMNPADEMAAKIGSVERQSAGAAAGLIDEAGVTYKLDEQLRVSVEALLHPNPPREPVEELDDLLLAISHHLNQETSERKAIYYRLAAIESTMKGRSSRGFGPYLIAICIGVAATLAWQSYGGAAKRIFARSVPELGWSQEARQMIASWIEQLGSTQSVQEPPEAAPAVKPAVAPKVAAAFSLDAEQMQQLTRSLTTLRQTVEQLAAGQNQIAREIEQLQTADAEILAKIPAPARPIAAPARKPTPIAPPTPQAPIRHRLTRSPGSRASNFS